MTVTLEGMELVIRIQLETPRPSKSGKTLVVATSGGNVATGAIIQGKPIIVGLNAYIAL